MLGYRLAFTRYYVAMSETTELIKALPLWENIAQASKRIDSAFLNSPIIRHQTLDDALGCRMVSKVETINPIRSFKGRGASLFVALLGSNNLSPLVAASVGNFGQGLAYAAGSQGRPLTIFAAISANPLKVSAMRDLGATVILQGTDFDEAKELAREFARSTEAMMVIDGDEPSIAEGAGTIAYELTHQYVGPPLDAVLVPVGGGALVTGIGTWLKHVWPTTQVIAVAASGAPAMARSWEASARVATESVDTIADGIAVRVPDEYALRSMAATVDDVITVDDSHIIESMRLIHQTLGLVTEPAGAVGIAAVLADKERWSNKAIGTVLCGSNIDSTHMDDWLK